MYKKKLAIKRIVAMLMTVLMLPISDVAECFTLHAMAAQESAYEQVVESSEEAVVTNDAQSGEVKKDETGVVNESASTDVNDNSSLETATEESGSEDAVSEEESGSDMEETDASTEDGDSKVLEDSASEEDSLSDETESSVAEDVSEVEKETVISEEVAEEEMEEIMLLSLEEEEEIIKIPYSQNEAYCVSDAGTLLCTLSGRRYTKTNDGMAFAAYAYLGTGYTAPILISQDADAVTYSTENQVFTYSTSFEYMDTTWYVSSSGYHMGGNCTSSGGVLQKLPDRPTNNAAAAKYLLENYLAFRIVTEKEAEIVLSGVLNEEGMTILSWQGVEGNVKEYHIFRDGVFLGVVENATGDLSFCDTTITAGKTSEYNVYGVNADGKIVSLSNEISVTTKNHLVISSNYTLTADMEVFSVELNGGTFNLNGHKLTVQRDFVQNNATLIFNSGVLDIKGNYNVAYRYARVTMNGANDYLFVGHNLILNNYYYEYTNGTIELCGDFIVAEVDSYRPSGFHTMILSGSGAQNISMTNNSYFQNLEINNYSEEGIRSQFGFTVYNYTNTEDVNVYVHDRKVTVGTVLEEDLVIDEDYHFGFGVLDLNGHTLTVNGNLYQEGGSLKVNGGNLIVNGDYYMATPYEVEKENETVIEYGRSCGILVMTSAEDNVVVAGNFLTMSAVNHSGYLTNGVLEVKGNFTASAAYSEYNFIATGNHKVLFSGEGKQEVATGTNASDRSRLSNMEITNAGEEGVVFNGNVRVTGTISDVNAVAKGSITIQSSTVFATAFGGSVYIRDTVETGKDADIKGNMIILGGRLRLRSKWNVGGYVHVGEGGCTYSYFELQGGELTVGGDLSSDMNYRWGYIYLSDSRGGKIHVNGNIKLSDHTEISASYGTIEVEKNVTSAGSFRLSGSNRFVLCGDEKQTISIPDSGYFATLELLNTSEEGVYAAKAFGRTTLIRNGCHLTYGNMQGEFGWTLEEDETWEGDLVLIDDVLDLNGHTLTVTGDLIQNAGEVRISGGCLEVAGDYRIQSRVKNDNGTYSYGMSGGTLRMTNAADYVVVGGSFVMSSSANHNGYLTNGVLEVKGNFTVNSTYSEYNFIATGNHKVIFSGEGKQEVATGTNASDRSRLSNMEITNAGEEGVVFNGNVRVTGTISDANTVAKGSIVIQSSTVFATAFGGSVYILDTIETSNDADIKGNMIILGGRLRLRSKWNVGGYVHVGEGGSYYSYFELQGGELTVGGDLSSDMNYRWGYIYLSDNRGGKIHVKGNINLNDHTEISGSYGTIEVEKNVTSAGTFRLSGSNRFVLCGDEKQTISIPDSGYFATLELLNTSEEGVYSEKAFARGTLIRNGCHLTYGTMQGEFGWTLEEDEIWEGDLVLIDDVLDLNGHTLTVTGNLIQNAGEVRVSGGRLEVVGDYRIQGRTQNQDGTYSYGKSSGILRMTNAADYVVVSGSFATSSTANHNGCLTNGVLEVKGNFTVNSTYSEYNFIATGNHKVIFSGEGKQEVATGTNASDRSRLSNMEITNAGEEGVVFNGNVRVTGTISDANTVAKGSITIQSSTVFATAFGGSVYILDTVETSNDADIKGNMIILGGRLRLRSKWNVGGYVHVGEGGSYYSYFELQGGELTVGGDLSSDMNYRWGYIYLSDNRGGKIHVKGNINLNDHIEISGSYGTIEVEKNVTTAGTFRLSGSNRFVLCGDEKQTVTIPTSGCFATVELDNHSKDGVYFTRNFVRTKLIRNGCRLSCADLICEYGWTLEDHEIWDGDLVLYDDVLDLNGYTLTVTGDLIHMGGDIKINNGTLIVEGDYRLQSMEKNGDQRTYNAGDGRLLIQNEEDEVTVYGNFIMQSSKVTTGWFSAGTLELHGNFSQVGNYAYQASGTNTIIFAGAEKQTLLAATATAVFVNYTNKNGAELVNNTPITVTGIVKDEANNISGSGTVSVKSVKQIENGIYSGNLTITEADTLDRDLTVRGTLTFNKEIHTKGHNITTKGLYIYNAPLWVEKALITCSGNMTISNSGRLVMTNAEDYVLVNGNFTINGYQNHSGYLTDGVLEVRGDFTQSNSTNFIATDNHTVILSRKKSTAGRDYIQTVNFQAYAGTTRFNKVVLKKADRQYHFVNALASISNEVIYSIDDVNPPTAVTSLIAESVSETRVKLVFDGATDNIGILGYEIYRNEELVGVTSTRTYTDLSVTPNTTYVYNVYAFDNDRNLAEDSPSLEITTKPDTEAPTVPTELSMSTRTGSSITLSWLASRDNVKVAGYTVYCEDQVIAEKVTGTTFKAADLEKNKVYHFTVEAYDNAGNRSEKSIALEATVAAPQITKVEPADHGSIGGENVDITVYFRNVGNSVGNKVNLEMLNESGEWEKINEIPLSQKTSSRNELYARYTWNLSDLDGEKEYSLKATLSDADNNTDTKEFTYLVDKQAPAVVENLKAQGNDGNVTLTWDPSSSADCDSYNIYRKAETEDRYKLLISQKGHFENSYVDSQVNVGATYNYQITSVDVFGNESEACEAIAVYVDEDTQCPEVKSITPKAGRIHDAITVEAEAQDNRAVAKIGLQYKAEDDENWTDLKEITAVSGKITFSWDTKGLADGVYYLNAYAIDTNNNRSEENFVRRYEIDNTGIAKISITNTEVASSYVRIEWEDVTEEDFAYFQIEKLVGSEFVKVDTVSDKLGYYVRDLVSKTQYTFRVVGYDNLGNRGEASDEIVVETSEDKTAPYITEVAPAASYYKDKLSLKLTAKDDSALGKAVFSYSTDGVIYKEIATRSTDKVTTVYTYTHELDLAQIPEGKLYVKFEVYDKCGNKNALGQDGKDIVVEYQVDRTAPAAVKNVQALHNEGYVELTWDDASVVDSDVKAFRIYRADHETGVYSVICQENRAKNYYDTSVKVSGTYLYKVSAIDIAGNEGECSEEIIVTVADDNEAPYISGISPADGDTVGANPTIKVLAMDNSGLSKIKLEYQVDSTPGIWSLIDNVNAQGNAHVATVTWNTKGLQEGAYTVRAIPTDLYGNVGDAYVVKYTLDNTAPVFTEAYVETGHFETIIHMNCESTDDFSYFEVQRRDAGQKNWVTLAKTAENEYRDTTAEANVTYVYQVLAYDVSGNVSKSGEMSGYADGEDNIAPEVSLPDNIVGLVNMEIALDGTACTDNVRIVKYEWDMGNGDMLTGAQPRYTYKAPGDYTVVLTVTDAAGNTGKGSLSIHIYEKTGRGKSKVHVIDEKGCGIPHALIAMRLDDDNYVSLKADAEGNVDIVSEVGIYSVAAYKTGYLPADVDVLISEYEEKEYTITLVEDELIVGDLTVRRMSLEEMVEAGVDFSNPSNYYSYVFTIELTFERRNFPVDVYVIGGAGSRYGGGGSGGGGGGGGGGTYGVTVINRPNPSEPEKVEPILAYVTTTQTVSWLKDMYSVELGILNQADYQYSVVDAVAKLNLPSGLSLAATKNGQSRVQSMGEIAGQQRKSVQWVVTGDKKGTYSLSADFSGTLLPFNEPVSAHFDCETEIDVNPGAGIVITVMPESTAYIGKDYYIQFAIANEGNYPLYNFSTSIGAFQSPNEEFSYTNVDTGETETDEVEVTIDDPSNVGTAVVVHNGQTLTFKTLYPGQVFYGTYKTTFSGGAADDDPEKHYYQLVEELATALEEENYGVTIRFSPISSHIHQSFYRIVEIPTYVGDPVDITSGYFSDEITALAVQGATSLVYDLQYSSGMTEEAGQFGYGWHTDYDMKLDNKNGLVRFYMNPDSSMLFVHKNAVGGYLYGRKIGSELLLTDQEKYTYGEYICINGSNYGCKLVRENDGTYTMTMPSGGKYTFNAAGSLTSISDAEGNTLTLSYEGNVTTITETTSGKKIFCQYNDQGLVAAVSDQGGRRTEFTYDGNKNLTAVTMPTQDVIRYVYDDNHKIISESNGFGTFVSNTYDASGRVLTQADAYNNVTTFSYDTSNANKMVVSVTNPDGSTRQAVVGMFGKVQSYTDENGAVTSYSYDSHGNMVIEKDAKGNAIYKEYDNNGNIVKVIDKGGVVSRMTYDHNGNVIYVDDAAGNSAKYSYKGSKMTSTTDYNGLTTRYEYNENGQLVKETTDGIGSVLYGYTNGMITSVTDYEGNVTRSEYDAVGNLVKSIDAYGNATTYTYDALGRTTSVGYADGTQEVFTYDCNGNLTSETDTAGRTTRYVFDISGRQLSQEMPDGTKMTFEYDRAGNCTKETYADGTYCTASYDSKGNRIKDVFADGTTMTYTYDALNQRTSETDSDGNTVSYAYYPNGNLQKVTYPDGTYELYTYNDKWKVVAYTDRSGATTGYTYDAMNNVTSEKDALGNTFRYEYDKLGRLLKETDANGNSTTYEYDANSNCVKKTNAVGVSVNMVYDDLNRMTSAYTTDKNGVEYRASYTYDSMGRVISSTDEEGNVTYMNYNKAGELVSMKDPNGNVVSVSEYDKMGRVSKVTDALGVTTEYQYDKVGNLVKTVELLNSGNRERTYEYDKMGRMTASTENGKLTSKAFYDNKGNITSVRDANGGITQYSYDNQNRLVKTISPMGNATTYTYNAAGLLNEMTNARNQKTQYSYDVIGRVTTVTDEAGTIHYTYDKNGNVLTVKDENGTITRTYDALNRVTSYTDYKGNTVKYSYDELGNLISLTYPGGEIVRYTYYKNGWLQTVVDSDGKTTKYTYDGNGNMLTCTRPNGTKETRTYNSAGLLLTQKDVAVTGTGDSKEEKILTNFTYSYDQNGNVTSIEGTETMDTAEGLSGIKTASFKYDAENRMIEYNGETVRYDADGNMIYGPVDGVMSELVYDCRNRLISAGGVTYTYDAENNRVSAETATYLEEYVNDTVSSSLSRVLTMTTYSKTAGKVDAKGEQTIYFYGDGLISEKQGGIVLYHHYNHLGSTMKLTDGRGNVVATFTYGTYGELLSGNTDLTKYLYNGKAGVSTDSNGLYYMRQRYYNPEIKRFVNQDVVTGSIDNSQSLNLYSYVQGNPVSYTDPFGLSPSGGLFSGTFWAHALFGVLGCIPGPVGIVANLADAAVYALVDHDYASAALSVLGAVTMGAGSIAKAAAAGSKLARTATYVQRATSLISNTASFAMSASHAMETGFKMYDKYVIQKKEFNWSDPETRNEVFSLGMDVFSMTTSAIGMKSDTKQLAKMMQEDQVLSKLKNAAMQGAADLKCGVQTAITGEPHCFVAGTKIKTLSGLKNIEDIEVGDYVYSKDPESGEEGYKEVLQLYVNNTDALVDLTIGDTKITTTATHPFWVVGEGFKNASELKRGEKVLTATGETRDIVGVEIRFNEELVVVYNFEVADWHTYYVSDDEILVHNACRKAKSSTSTGLKEFDVAPYGEFKKHPNDGLSGHELLQNAWLEANGKITGRGKGLSPLNPAIALRENPMHKFITKSQKNLGLTKKNLAGVSWRQNVMDNIQLLKKAGVPRDKIAELAWLTRKFAIDNGF